MHHSPFNVVYLNAFHAKKTKEQRRKGDDFLLCDLSCFSWRLCVKLK